MDIVELKWRIREIDELREERKQKFKQMYVANKKAKEEYVRDHVEGYCPHCHCLLPRSRVCDICGEKW